MPREAIVSVSFSALRLKWFCESLERTLRDLKTNQVLEETGKGQVWGPQTESAVLLEERDDEVS